MKEHERAEEPELEEEIAEAPSSFTATADAIVMSPSEAKPSPEVAAYLAAQTKLLGVQSEHMHEQRELQLEHLRVRRWRERL